MTISDDRLAAPTYLAFLEKLTNHHYWTADDDDSIPDDLAFTEPFPFTLDMRQVNS